MAKLIRRTLILTIHEQWTFVWTPEQTNDSQVAEEDTLLASAELMQQLWQLLGLPERETTVDPGNSVQIFVHYQPKE